MRPGVSVFVAVSLDGHLARADGGLDWLDAVQDPATDYGFSALLERVDALILGRATWDVVMRLGGWSYGERPAVVWTRRPLGPDATHGEVAREGALAPIVDELGAAGARRIYLDGGQAIRQGLREGLVDELVVSVVPIVLGGGIPLFGEVPESAWRVSGSESYASGLVQLRYTRA